MFSFVPCPLRHSSSFFFFNDTATTEIYTLSLHDALPISGCPDHPAAAGVRLVPRDHLDRRLGQPDPLRPEDRKSTRLNSSHQIISYAVFCLKKKKAGDGHRTGRRHFSDRICPRLTLPARA